MGPTLDTVIIGAGQAGLATSYWLTQFGVEHRILERRATLGGAFQDRWDSFYMNTPNLALDLPGMPYDGDDRDAFISRDAAVNFFRRYADLIAAPVETSVDVTRLSVAPAGGLNVETTLGNLWAQNVVLATGAYQVPKIPALTAGFPEHVVQLHTHDYRNPEQLPDGAVLVVGTGQSGGQIAEELHAAGRDVHLSVSIVPEAPRRYRGQDLIYWMLETGKHGPDFGVNALTREALPSPAARFAPNPLLSGVDGGHSIHLRELGRRGMHLHGHVETVDDGGVTFSDDLPERLATVESVFAQRSGKAIDAYIAAAGIDAREQAPSAADEWLPAEQAELSLADANITSVVWASGYKLDFGFVDLPLVDEWGYPKHSYGVTEFPGLYVVGLPWLTRHYSAIVGGVGLDAKYIAERISGPPFQTQ